MTRLPATAAIFISIFILPAQETPTEAPTFSTDVKVVNLFATVHAKSGAIIRGLSKDDFTLLENGRPQRIQYFSKESDLPLTIGLLIDTSVSQRKVLDAERGASMRFLDQVLREKKDRMFILQFDTNLVMRQALTASRRDLDEALAWVDTETRQQLIMQQGGSTKLYDAVVKASAEVMQQQSNRKALILLTDGVDTGSDATLAQAIETAVRADTLIYSILFADASAYGLFGGGDGRGALTRMSRETGGGFFEVTKKRSIEQIFGLIEDELRSQYSIGFVSDAPVRISEYRQLRLATRDKGQIVQARDRYWAKR